MKKYKKTFIFCKKTEEIKVFQRLFFLPGAFTDEIGINGKITVMPFFCDLTVGDGSGNGAIGGRFFGVRAVGITAVGKIFFKFGEAVRQILEGIEIKFNEIEKPGVSAI